LLPLLLARILKQTAAEEAAASSIICACSCIMHTYVCMLGKEEKGVVFCVLTGEAR
jgi:gluconate kinase